MEQNWSSCENYPLLVCQNLDDKDEETGVYSIFNLLNRLSFNCIPIQCRIPELLRRHIRGVFHGWVVLSDHPHNIRWSLWNPITSNFIRLPPLVKEKGDFDDIGYCCLPSPPDDSNSILLLMRFRKPTVIFCRLDRRIKKSRWTEMSYAKQLKKVTDKDGILQFPTCCNGKVYALSLETDYIIEVDIVVKDREVVISLLPFREFPFPFFKSHLTFYGLKGSCTELFCILLGFDPLAEITLADVYLYKLDMTSTTSSWEEIEDLKDAVFFVGFDDNSIFYNPAIPSNLGGYVQILGQNRNIIYSYHVKDKTVSILPIFCLMKTSHVSLWEFRLKGFTADAKCIVDYEQREVNSDGTVIRSIIADEVKFDQMTNESYLLNIPFHVLEMIMDFCVGIEYLNIRATCKNCHLAAPLIQWRNQEGLNKLRTYSLVSPWLMVLEKKRGILSFTDPMCGDTYFMKALPVSIHENNILCCSGYGWLLLYYCSLQYLVFFNPFTSDLRELPTTPHILESLYFSAPPTSPECMVVGFTTSGEGHAYILHFVDRDPLWHIVDLDYGGAAPYAFFSLTFYGRDLYALCKDGEVVVFKGMSEENFSWEFVTKAQTKISKLTEFYLVKGDQHLLLVVIGEFVQLFQLNDEGWEKIDSLGSHMIYICGTSCLCIEAKIPHMQNKIYFPRLHSENGEIVFYSLEACRYQTFSDKNNEETYNLFFGTKYHLNPHAWIEPSWS